MARSRRLATTALFLLTAFALGDSASRAFPIRIPFFHHATGGWTQFRNGPDNNPVIPGRLSVSWRVETGAQISASPTLEDGTLYVGNNDGSLYAIDAATGHTRWTYRAGNPLMSAPLIYGDLVIVGEGDPTSRGSTPSEPVEVGRGPSALIALDRENGTVRWQAAMSGSAMPTPAIVDGVLVDHNGAGWVSGYDPQTGRKRFTRRLDSMASMTAILPMGRDQFVTAGVGTNAAFRMSARDGSIVWRSLFAPGASGIGDCPPVSDGARILCDYVAPSPPDCTTVIGHAVVERVYALDASSGAPAWTVSLDSGILPERNEAAIPLLADGALFVGSAIAPSMHALDPANGMVVWQQRTHGPVKGGAVYLDGAVYFGDLGGYLWALDPNTGSVIGDKDMHTPFNVGSPIVDGQTLIIGSDSGAIIAIPLADIRNAHDP